MDPIVLQKMIPEALVMLLFAALGSFLGSYLQTTGKNLAIKRDLEHITRTTAETKAEVQRRSSFHDMVLLERYNLIKDLNNRLEIVRINFERWLQGKPTKIEIISGETLMLTEIDAALNLDRAVLTEDFYELLRERYNIAAGELWKCGFGSTEWNCQMAKWNDLNFQIQSRMRAHFPFQGSTIPDKISS